jgi:hypothetical protein
LINSSNEMAAFRPGTLALYLALVGPSSTV